ncbi:MAG: two-component sensor histidine kinase [Burkholderiales bacterium]|nr:two-component sensor histidine kinase [Burkholderiales bacterium]
MLKQGHLTSIRRHLLVWLLGALSAGAVLLALASYTLTLSELNEVFDRELKQVALAALTHHQDEVASPRPGWTGPEFAFVTQVWSEDGVRLFVSTATSTIPFVREEGFQTVRSHGEPWRVYTVRSASRFVQAAQPLEARRERAAASAVKLLVPSMLVVLVIAALIRVALQRGLAPLRVAAADVGRRSAASLEPIPDASLPEEIRPLVGSINALMQRLSQAFAAQRRFIADAAHELRTPLTALRLQVQLVEGAGTEADRAEALADLRHGLTRASHLITQLLDLSRLEPDGAEHRKQAIDLAALARAVVGEFGAQAAAKAIDLGAEAGTPAKVDGDEAELRLLIANLVDNALRYTPAGGRVDVGVRAGSHATILEVRDDGRGIPPDESSRVFERFYRASNADRGEDLMPGTGLGLAIVKAVADRHGACVSLEPGIDGRGLRVVLSFPPGGAERPRPGQALSRT